jgi:hypothetical protein
MRTLVRRSWTGEFLLAKSLHKRIFGLVIDPMPFERLPAEMTAEWQLCELVGEDPFRTFEVEVFGKPAKIAFREVGLDLLRRGLERAGLDARSFPWPPRNEPDRAPYRGLKALEPQDAAIFFGAPFAEAGFPKRSTQCERLFPGAGTRTPNAPRIRAARFAHDSPLEESGFEPLVPR